LYDRAVSDQRQLFTMFRNAFRAAHAGHLSPAFHRFPQGIRSFTELNCVMVAAIRQRQRRYDVAANRPAQTVSNYRQRALCQASGTKVLPALKRSN
jgi:hypothetical protein